MSITNAAPVERFKPTSGQLMGYAGLLMAAFAIGYVATSVHTVTGLRIGLAAAFFAVLTWATQLRPRATAYPHALHLKNVLRDARIPLVAIEEVAVGQTLNVWADGRRYLCVGIGLSMRDNIKQARKKNSDQSLLGKGRLREFAEMAERAAPDQSAMAYPTFVVTRIEELVGQAKRSGEAPEGRTPRATYAWPELAALVVTGLAFVVSLLT